MKPQLDKPRCVNSPCPMTMGFYIGGGQYICWLHILRVSGAIEAVRGQKLVALLPAEDNETT